MQTDKAVAKPYFDYNAVTAKEVRADLRDTKAKYGAWASMTMKGAWHMGERLARHKEQLPHGQFMEFVERELHIGQRMVANFMHIYSEFKLEIISNLDTAPTVLYLLAAPSVSDETREVATELIKAGELHSVKDAKALIEASKPATTDPEPLPESEMHDDGGTGYYPDEVAGHPRPITDAVLAGTLGAATEPTPELAARNGAAHDPDGLYVERIEATVNDDLPEAPPTAKKLKVAEEADMTDAEWMDSLPAWATLKALPNHGHRFRAAALAYRGLAGHLRALTAAISKQVEESSPDAFPALMRQVSRLPHPRKWEVCRACKGSAIFEHSDCDCRGGYRLWQQ